MVHRPSPIGILHLSAQTQLAATEGRVGQAEVAAGPSSVSFSVSRESPYALAAVICSLTLRIEGARMSGNGGQRPPSFFGGGLFGADMFGDPFQHVDGMMRAVMGGDAFGAGARQVQP